LVSLHSLGAAFWIDAVRDLYEVSVFFLLPRMRRAEGGRKGLNDEVVAENTARSIRAALDRASKRSPP